MHEHHWRADTASSNDEHGRRHTNDELTLTCYRHALAGGRVRIVDLRGILHSSQLRRLIGQSAKRCPPGPRLMLLCPTWRRCRWLESVHSANGHQSKLRVVCVGGDVVFGHPGRHMPNERARRRRALPIRHGWSCAGDGALRRMHRVHHALPRARMPACSTGCAGGKCRRPHGLRSPWPQSHTDWRGGGQIAAAKKCAPRQAAASRAQLAMGPVWRKIRGLLEGCLCFVATAQPHVLPSGLAD